MRRSRSAFTLVELLVVIAVIGILVALLLPAVQAAREAARRLQCVNHLKQIGLGLHNYHSTFNVLPMSTTGAESYGSQGGSGFYSWLALLLPFVEQSPLYDSIDFRQPMMDTYDQVWSSDYQVLTISASHPNAGAAATTVPLFLCPSDTFNMTPVLGTANPAPGNYAANIGWPRQCTGIDGHSSPLTRLNGATWRDQPQAARCLAGWASRVRQLHGWFVQHGRRFRAVDQQCGFLRGHGRDTGGAAFVLRRWWGHPIASPLGEVLR